MGESALSPRLYNLVSDSPSPSPILGCWRWSRFICRKGSRLFPHSILFCWISHSNTSSKSPRQSKSARRNLVKPLQRTWSTLKMQIRTRLLLLSSFKSIFLRLCFRSTIVKRYSQFHSLHNRLMKKKKYASVLFIRLSFSLFWLSSPKKLPRMPKKKIMNMDPNFVQKVEANQRLLAEFWMQFSYPHPIAMQEIGGLSQWLK